MTVKSSLSATLECKGKLLPREQGLAPYLETVLSAQGVQRPSLSSYVIAVTAEGTTYVTVKLSLSATLEYKENLLPREQGLALYLETVLSPQ